MISRLFPENASLARWIDLARKRIHFQGCPRAFAGWATASAREFGVEMNRMVADGRLKAPIVIGRDHLDCGSVASPYRETEAMPDGSDAIADWPILNALLNTAAGASWVSVHNGGGVGIGYSLHAGQVIVADGTASSERCLERVLTADPGIGVLRHVDAGYQPAVDFARQAGLRAPRRKPSGEMIGMTGAILVRRAGQLLTLRGPAGPRRGAALGDLGLIRDGAVLIRDGRIEAAGPGGEVEKLAAAKDAREIDAAGRVVMPGFVDSHTHLVFAPAKADGL